jgi:hypothetical protein
VHNFPSFLRDGEEWLKHRQIMNNFLLKDSHWFESLVEGTCDNFVNKIKRIANNESDVAVDNLEDEIYLWTSYCNLSLKFEFQREKF